MDRHEADVIAERLRNRYRNETFGEFLVALLDQDNDPLEHAANAFADIRSRFGLTDEDVASLHGDDMLRIANVASTVGGAVAQSDFAKRRAKAFIERFTKNEYRHQQVKGLMGAAAAAAEFAAICLAYIDECRSLAIRKGVVPEVPSVQQPARPPEQKWTSTVTRVPFQFPNRT